MNYLLTALYIIFQCFILSVFFGASMSFVLFPIFSSWFLILFLDLQSFGGFFPLLHMPLYEKTDCWVEY